MATQIKQGQTIVLTSAETEVTFAGYVPQIGLPVKLIVVAGSFQYAVAPIGSDPVIAASGYATVTTAGTSRDVSVPNGFSLRLKGATTATVEITW